MNDFFLSSSEVSPVSPRRFHVGWGIEPAMHDTHDYIVTTGHHEHFEKDYANFKLTGAAIARSGIRTRHANPERGVYVFDDILEQARAAKKNGITVFWDLAHYDIPRYIRDPWNVDELAEVFTGIAFGLIEAFQNAGCNEFGICVFNEILFWAWCVDNRVLAMQPDIHTRERAGKWRLICTEAAMKVMKAIRERNPNIPLLLAEPCDPDNLLPLLAYMKTLDAATFNSLIIGLNLYPHTVGLNGCEPADFLPGVVARISDAAPRNQIIIAETGWYGAERLSWFEKMEKAAQASGIDTMVWYPAINHEAWDNSDLLVEHGGWDQDAERTPYEPLLDAVRTANGVNEEHASNEKKKASATAAF
jgi:hypothetical protein